MQTLVTLASCLTLILSLAACGGETAFTSSSSATASPAAPGAAMEETASPAPSESAPAPAGQEESAASAPGEQQELHHVKIEVENYGTISLELDAASAPETVENFLALAGDGFYDGLTFHRIIDGFMIQGGDPMGNGTGGSSRNIPGEFASNGFPDNQISHVRGAVSMARAFDPDSASSQFFIVQADSTFLDGEYAAFGHVTGGMEVVDAICADANPVDNNGTISSKEQPVMTSVTVID